MDSSSKVAGDAGLGKVRRAGTDGRMAVTETRQTTETIAFIQVEISRLAFVAVLTFHMLLTLTLASKRCTTGYVIPGASHTTSTRTTAADGELEEVDSAVVTLVTSHAGLTLADPRLVTLGLVGPNLVTLASQTFLLA